MSKGHGYTWEDVHDRPASELAPGDVFITPGRGTAFHTSMDGEDVRGVGWLPLDGIAWTVIERDGETVKATSLDAGDVTGTIPTGKKVLIVKPEAKK